jgi:hypothetical protein
MESEGDAHACCATRATRRTAGARARVLPDPVPTRVVWRNRRFEPPQGFDALLDGL